jgi:hypothetical protein
MTMQTIDELEQNTFWKHKTTGRVYVLRYIDHLTGEITIVQNRPELSFKITAGQLVGMYVELEDDEAREYFDFEANRYPDASAEISERLPAKLNHFRPAGVAQAVKFRNRPQNSHKPTAAQREWNTGPGSKAR